MEIANVGMVLVGMVPVGILLVGIGTAPHLIITPSVVMSSHLFIVMSVISVSSIICLKRWVRFGLGIGTENSVISNLFDVRVDGK